MGRVSESCQLEIDMLLFRGGKPEREFSLYGGKGILINAVDDKRAFIIGSSPMGPRSTMERSLHGKKPAPLAIDS
jgi:hypothetical protein